MATIRDVARAAGVSRQTVSNVLNGRLHHTMTVETRMRVLGAMRELEYHPNANAARLRRLHARTIAFTVLDPSPHFLGEAVAPAYRRSAATQ